MGAAAAQDRRALGGPLERRGGPQQAPRREVGDEAELLDPQRPGAAGLEPGQQLLEVDEALVSLVLRYALHQVGPVRIARVVVPDEDPAAGPDDPHHLLQRPAHRVGVGDVVHRRDREAEVELAVGERHLGAGALHRPDLRRALLHHVEHPLRRIEADHVVAEPRPARAGEDAGAAADVEEAARRRRGLQHEPGITVRPCRSITRVDGPASFCTSAVLPVATIFPSRIAIACRMEN